MKNPMKTSIVLVFAAGLSTAAGADTLKLKVQTKREIGSVRAAVFSSEDAFANGDFVTAAAGKVSAGNARIEFNDLKPGTYGIAIFQDLNNNEELDRNLFGAPNEPYGFSRNPIVKFSAPTFDAFKFEYEGDPMELDIILNGG